MICMQAALAAAVVAAATTWAAAVTEEAVTMVQGLGVVLSARRRCWWRPASTFVPAERIRHIVINEVQRMVAAHSQATQLAIALLNEHAAA